MTIRHEIRREKRQFEPRHVIVMMFGTAAILYAAAVYSMAWAEVPLPERHAAAVQATQPRVNEAEAPVQSPPQAYEPVRSLGYVVFDFAEADAAIPGFGPLTSDGQ